MTTTVRPPPDPVRIAPVAQAEPLALPPLQLIGPPGPAGPAGAGLVLTAAETLPGHRFLTLTAEGEAALPDPAAATDLEAIIGMSEQAAISGQTLSVTTCGVVEHAGWSWPPGAAIFAGPGGVPTATPPASGPLRKLAVAIGATAIKIDLGPLIRLA